MKYRILLMGNTVEMAGGDIDDMNTELRMKVHKLIDHFSCKSLFDA